MRLRIGFVRVLIEKRPFRMLLSEFDCSLHRTIRTFSTRRKDDFGPEDFKKLATLDRHILGKNDFDGIALDAGDHCQRNAGVSRRRFNDGLAGRKGSVGFGILDHGQSDAVFDRTGRVLTFHLPEDAHIRVRAEHGDVNYRRVADYVEYRGVNSHRRPLRTRCKGGIQTVAPLWTTRGVNVDPRGLDCTTPAPERVLR